MIEIRTLNIELSEFPSMIGVSCFHLTKRTSSPVYRVTGYYSVPEGNGLQIREYEAHNEAGAIKKAIKDEYGLETLLMVGALPRY